MYSRFLHLQVDVLNHLSNYVPQTMHAGEILHGFKSAKFIVALYILRLLTLVCQD